MSALVRRKALRTFRQRGVVVHVGALEHLFAAYETLPDFDFPNFLDSVFDLLGRPDGATDGILTRQVAESIAARLQRDSDRKDGLATATAEVIDIFTVPGWQSSAQASSNAFFAGKRVSAPKRPVIDALAPEKANMFRMRYELLRGKTLRNHKFTPPASGILSLAKQSPYFRLTGIESLAGTKGERLVLGMLTQLEEGTWYLEDLNGVIRIDLSQASHTAGLHTECSFVIAKGKIVEIEGEEPYFQVSLMGTPPYETREASLNAMSRNSNLFGGQMETAETASLLKMEKEDIDSFFLLLSDVALDNSKVIAGIRYLLQSYVDDGLMPKIIVLMGNFLSHPFGQHVTDMTVLADKFKELGNLLRSDFPAFADECMFVIIPSTKDPGPGNVLPRPPMPNIVMKGFIDAIGAERVHLGTNPCRIRYMTQEIVIMRDDLIQKMVRQCAVKPDFSQSVEMSEHFIKSVIDQSHLCPLPTSARPVLWRHAHAMWLFPVPHAIIVADKVDSYIVKYEGNLGLNPGSFNTDFSFQIYLPAQRRAQKCSLDSESILQGKPSTDGPVKKSNADDASEPEENENDDIVGDRGSGTDAVDDVDEEQQMPDADQDVEMEEPGGSDSEFLPQLAQPREGHLQSEFDQGGELLENSTENLDRRRGVNEEYAISVDGQQVYSQGNADSESETESDDDSLLMPVDGIEKRDIKALIRESMAEDDSGPLQEEG